MALLDGMPERWWPGLCDGTTNQHAAVLWASGLGLSDVGSACGSRPYVKIRSLSRSALGWEELKSGGLCAPTPQPLTPEGSQQGPIPESSSVEWGERRSSVLLCSPWGQKYLGN